MSDLILQEEDLIVLVNLLLPVGLNSIGIKYFMAYILSDYLLNLETIK